LIEVNFTEAKWNLPYQEVIDMGGRLNLISRFGSYATILLALMGLFAYLPGMRLLGSFSPEYIPMAPSTAVSFIILSCCLLLIQHRLFNRQMSYVLLAGSFSVMLFGVLCFLGWYFEMDLNFEAALIPSAGRFNGLPIARMSPATGITFFFAAISAFLIVLKQKFLSQSNFVRYPLNISCFSTLVISFTFTLAYVYGTPLLYGAKTIPMALTTALGFLALAISLMCFNHECLLVTALKEDTTRSSILRYFLPLNIAAVIIGGVSVFLSAFAKVNPAIFAAITTVILAVISGAVAGILARHLGGEIDRSREEVKKANEMLRINEEKFRTTLNSIGDAVIATNKNGKVVQMNPIGEFLTGWKLDEAQGRPLNEIFEIRNAKTGEKSIIPVDKVISTGEIVNLSNQTILISRDKRQFHIADSAAPITDSKGKITGVVLVFRDVTEENKIQSELHKIHRLQSLGILAGGIAHDFNNLLMGIYGNVSLAKTELRNFEKAQEYLEEAEKSMGRATHLTRQLLTFAKGGEPVRKDVRLEEIVKEVVNFDLVGSKVLPVIEVEEDLRAADVDQGQIQQVFSNLAINARDAMPDGGQLFIRIENVEIEKEQIADLRAGKYLKVVFKDQGVGIPADDIDNIFDPYYSTKESGTGLGLSTTFSIIKRHHGAIQVESQPGHGAAFTLYLPAADKSIIAREKKINIEGPCVRHTAKVMIMDDEKSIRMVAAKMLEKLGFKVTTVENGREAIDAYRKSLEDGKPFELIIMDLTIPGDLGGIEAIGPILEIDPEARVVVSSGYSDNPAMAKYHEYGFKDLLEKPYTYEELQTVVKRVLEN
jgi:PAS domain S-box-containing protein